MKNFQKRHKIEKSRRIRKQQQKEFELKKKQKPVWYTRQDFEDMAKMAQRHHKNHIEYVAEAEEKIESSKNLLKISIFVWVFSGIFFYFKFNIFNIEAGFCSLLLFVSVPLINKHLGYESFKLWQGELEDNLKFLNKMREKVKNYREEDYLITA